MCSCGSRGSVVDVDGDRCCRACCCGSSGECVVNVDEDRWVEGERRGVAGATLKYLDSEKIQRIKYLT